MPDADMMPLDLESELARLGPIEVVVGVPTWNNAGSVDEVLRAARQGAVSDGAVRAVVVFADGGSQDGTVAQAQEALQPDDAAAPALSLSGPESPPPRPERVPAKAGAIQSIFLLARRAGVKACVVLDADLLGIEPGWVGRLLRPVLEQGIDFAAPYYLRQRFAGALTTSVVYPLTRTLYGKRLRFPLGGDFACSPRLLERYLAQPAAWENELARSGPELWLSTQALVGGFRLRQVFLGTKRPAPQAAAEDLPHTLTRVLGGMFAELERHVAVWQKSRTSEAVEIDRPVPLVDPGAATFEVQRALDGFRLGQENLVEIWKLVLPPRTVLELRKLARAPESAFRLDDGLWARIVYDFALAYRLRTINRDHLLAGFTPLYLGWLASFMLQVGDADPLALENRIEQLCLRYEAEKPYLISRWRWPDRFSP